MANEAKKKVCASEIKSEEDTHNSAIEFGIDQRLESGAPYQKRCALRKGRQFKSV